MKLVPKICQNRTVQLVSSCERTFRTTRRSVDPIQAHWRSLNSNFDSVHCTPVLLIRVMQIFSFPEPIDDRRHSATSNGQPVPTPIETPWFSTLEAFSWLTHACHQRARYITRPAIAERRLSLANNGNVVIALKTPYDDGTTHVVLSPMEFMGRLAALVPKPRVNLTLSLAKS